MNVFQGIVLQHRVTGTVSFFEFDGFLTTVTPVEERLMASSV